MENVNYYELKNNQDREIAFDNIMSCLDKRIFNVSALKHKIINNIEIETSASIFRNLPNMILDIWCDDLSDNYTYLHILFQLCRIQKHPYSLELSKIYDDYLKVKENENFIFGFESKNKIYEIELKSSLYLDYNFLKPIIDAVNDNDIKGKYYLLGDESMEDGYSIIHLSDNEHELFVEKKIIEFSKIEYSTVESINFRLKN